MSMPFDTRTTEQIKAHGLSIAEVERQLQLFKNGIPFVRLDRPATVGDGIRRLSEAEQQELVARFGEVLNDAKIRIMKFVPASGAASRMFRDLETVLNSYARIDDAVLNKEDKGCAFAHTFISHIRDFAFWPALKQALAADGLDAEMLLKTATYRPLIDYTLSEKGLNYSSMPKALIYFHRSGEHGLPVTSLSEHFAEGQAYARSTDGKVALHFTVSPEFTEAINAEIEDIRRGYAAEVQFETELSTQQPSTDTIAVDEQNEPFLDENGDILFRPGGHGALLKNLNNLKADLVFIKNIDNVVPARLQEDTLYWKKVLGGLLSELREKIFATQNELEAHPEDGEAAARAAALCRDELNLSLPEGFASEPPSAQTALLRKLLDRPVRVCGMVKNEGEPGGGPFWVKKEGAVNRLQIVESDQMDDSDPRQMELVQQATHFNPVDIVCSLTNKDGKPYDLDSFQDPETAFIASKSYDGRKLKALERPGLWNGAMAGWISVFAEVPVATFNPVKTVNDLLRKQHQG
ncbi:MAG: DUF4301 family protein [Cyclonatronaceae bacterium]